MSIPSVYINLEDDVSKIVTRLKHNSAKQVILVCPKRCFLFSDSINLRLLKKQTDLLGKEVFILTMDDRGQAYAKEAGFALKFLPKSGGSSRMSDVKRPEPTSKPGPDGQYSEAGLLAGAVREMHQIAKNLLPAKLTGAEHQEVIIQPAKPKASPLQKIKITETIFSAPDGQPEPVEAVREEKGRPSKNSRTIAGAVALALIVILLLVFVILPRATVVVYAGTEPVTRDMEISMSTNIPQTDPSKLVMPATQVDESVNLNGTFQSQGKMQVGNKASGTVQIYNFTKVPINLKSSTTILTAGANTYTLVNDVLGIKPTRYSNAATKEVDPNSLGSPIQIIATSGGEDYNLPAGTRVEITNQVFGSRPLYLYAMTNSEINGGTTRYLSVISQDDVAAAQTQLQAQALQQINDKLKTSGLVLPEKSYTFSVTQFTTDNPVGTQTPSFQASLQAKVSGLAYKQDDLQSLISQRITQTLDTDKTLEPQTASSSTVEVKSYDPVNQLAVLTVHFQGEAVYDVSLPDIQSQLLGKSQDQANEILRSKAQIDKVEITLSPAWQKNLPLFARQIKVSVVQGGPGD